MTDYREQAVKDVAEEVATPIETVKFILSEGFDEDCEEDLLLRYAVAQREAALTERAALESIKKRFEDADTGTLAVRGGVAWAMWKDACAALNAVKEG